MFGIFGKDKKEKKESKELEEELKLDPTPDEDDDERFIRKDSQEQELEEFQEEVEEVIGDLDYSASILPESHQQRNLDRETGGLEQEKDDGISEKDVWDDRSEEVDRMGSVDPYGTSGKKSMLWKLKKKRLDEKEEIKEQAAEAAQEAAKARAIKKNSGTQFDSRLTSQADLGYATRVRQLQQDRSNSQGGGGMSR